MKSKKIGTWSSLFIAHNISARRNVSGMVNRAKELGIPLSNIYATGSNKAKVEKIIQLNISKHYDNNPDVIKELGKIGQLYG